MLINGERAFVIPHDLDRVLDVGASNLPINSRVTFDPDSVARHVGTNAAGISDVHNLGLRHAASPIIADAAQRRGAEDTWRRYRDSSFLIARITTSSDAVAAAKVIYDIHEPIVGTDEHGVESSALDPLHFANAAIRNWQHADATAQRLRLSEADRDQLALEELVKFQLIGVDDTHFPVGRAALAERARQLETPQHIHQTPLIRQLLDKTEPPAALGDFMGAMPELIERGLDSFVAGPLHGRLTDAALINLPTETQLAMGVDTHDWTARRHVTAHATRVTLERVGTYLGTHDSPYLRTHPDLVVDMYGEPRTNAQKVQLAASRTIANAVAGHPKPMTTTQLEL